MKIKNLLSLLLCAAMLLPGCSVAASAEETDTQKKTYTYYFLAPDNWFDTSCGAVNEDVGCYYQLDSDSPEETVEWPGKKMTPAFDIGDNVFKITGVPADADVVFNSYLPLDYSIDTAANLIDPQCVNVSTWGYSEHDAKEKYDGCPVTDNFDGFIFVINPYEGSKYSELSMATTYFGAWFKLDEYKNYPEFYGSYNIEKKKRASHTILLRPTIGLSQRMAQRTAMSARFCTVIIHSTATKIPSILLKR